MMTAGKIRIVQFEYGGCNVDARVLLKDIFKFFGKLDYTLYKLHPEGLERVIRYDQRLENFQYQNWIAMRQGSTELPHLVRE